MAAHRLFLDLGLNCGGLRLTSAREVGIAIGAGMATVGVSVILVGLAGVEGVPFGGSLDGRTTVPIPESQVEDIVLHLFDYLFQIRRLVLNDARILLNFSDHLGVLLEFLGKLDGLLQGEQPLLGSFLVLAGIHLLVGFFNDEVDHLLFHVEGHILLLNDLHPPQTTERSDFLWFFGVVRHGFVPDE